MCGIAGIISKQTAGSDLKKKIVGMSEALGHRGPDGSGFFISSAGTVTPCFYSHSSYTRTDLGYIPKTHISSLSGTIDLVFAHRRLAILDLSDTGHQPMCSSDTKTWITFNGEIYNYIELRDELKKLGHHFISGSDTEVILHAYKQWGFDCVKRFNGMWAFCIYDADKQICFASRDRLGVKPFYYLDNNQVFAFASEQKAFVRSGLINAAISNKAMHGYLINGKTETETENFFEGLKELWPGNNLIYDLGSKQISLENYFHLNSIIGHQNDGLNETQLIGKIEEALENAVRLRLRSDVEVGVCLSGGIDSSALALLVSEITRQPLFCFTAVFRGLPINEESYADIVVKQIGAKHAKMEPAPEGFLKEVENLVYSQDAPIWDTSTYAQYKVMELARANDIKVVLDGQGADELFGGYHHHFIARWRSMIAQGKYMDVLGDVSSSGKTIANPYLFFLKETFKRYYNSQQSNFPVFFTSDFIKSNPIQNQTKYFKGVNEQLLHDIYETRLKSFLKCEDRCGMWHSVESRTPFSDDIELMKLMFSFNGNRKIKNGVSKYLLREALKDKLPKEIYTRYDKKGFDTPMQDWMRSMRTRILSEVKHAGFDFVNYKGLEKSDPNNVFHNKLLFKLFVLSTWKKVYQ